MDNPTHDMSEALVRYLDGELTGIEKESLEQQLAADPVLQQEYENLRLTRESIRYYGLQQKVAGLHGQMMEEVKTPARMIGPAAKIIRYSIAVAASVILLVGGFLAYDFYTLSPTKIFASNYQSYELSNVRDGNGQALSPVEKAYQAKNYQQVIKLVQQSDSITVKETFLAAMSYEELGNNTGAIENYKKVIAESGANGVRDAAEYYLALAYIRNKDYDFALELLRKIKDDPDHLYHTKITGKLIRQVKMLKWR